MNNRQNHLPIERNVGHKRRNERADEQRRAGAVVVRPALLSANFGCAPAENLRVAKIGGF